MESDDDRAQGLPDCAGVGHVDPAVIDHAPRGLDEEAPGAGGEVEHAALVAPVALDTEDPFRSGEARAVEHEPDDGARRVELAEAVAVDVVDVGLVQAAQHVGAELRERQRHERVEHVGERLVARSVPVVVVVAEEPAVARAATVERLVQYPPKVAVHLLVDQAEAAVVQAVLHEARVLPSAVEQNPRQRELRDPHEVLIPRSASHTRRVPIGGDRHR